MARLRYRKVFGAKRITLAFSDNAEPPKICFHHTA